MNNCNNLCIFSVISGIKIAAGHDVGLTLDLILKTKSSKTAEDIHPLETNSKKNILDFKKDAKNIGMLLKGSTFMDVCFS